MTPESWQQELADLAAAQRATQWSIGDTICEAIKASGNQRRRMAIFRAAASVLMCSTSNARLWASVAATFKPGPMRMPDVDWSIYRACMQAARRLKKTPLDVLAQALAENLHVKGIRALGLVPKTNRSRYAGPCEECGAAIWVELETDSMRGHPVGCPVCTAHPQVGVLSA